MLIAIERLIRRKPVVNAIGGLFGIGLAAFIAVRSGKAEGFFVPKMLYQFALGVVFAGSVADPQAADRLHHRPALPRRAGLGGAPRGAAGDDRVHARLGGAVPAARRASTRCSSTTGGSARSPSASIAMGLPAFGLLLFLGYRYVPKRLEQLGAPPPRQPSRCSLSAR